jgi:nitrate/TMAO reductase-like tetraheme cytochrome c subunit
MMRGFIGAAVVVWALVGAAASQAGRQQTAPPPPTPPSNADCLTCHEDDSAARADGRPVVVKPAVFEKSVHGPLSCVDCHQDLGKFSDFPHPEKLAKVDCSSCHSDAVAQYKASVHSTARERGPTVAATCVDCHGLHDILPKADPQSRTYHFNVAETCAKCHGNADIIRKGGIPSDVTVPFRDSIHGQALMKSGLIVAPTCSDCHGAHEIRGKKDVKSQVSLAHVPATCGKCHEGISRKFDAGVHGSALAAGNTGAPACQICHTAHTIQRVESTAWQLSVIGKCGGCHAERIATFRDTLHGQVTSLGFRTVASCADCHGAHEVLPASDPRSPISPGRLVETCRKCHEYANERFVQFDPHADKHSRTRSPSLYYTAQFMNILLLGVFGFFGAHTALWFGKELRERRKNRWRR